MKPLILLIAIVLVGCLSQDANGTSRNPDYYIDHIVDNGHSYLVVVTSVNYGYHQANIIHAEHCNCKGGGK